MNKIGEILDNMAITIGTAQAEVYIFQLIDKLIPKKYSKVIPQNDFEKGMAHAFLIVEQRIAELKEMT